MNFCKFTLDEIDLIMDALQEEVDELYKCVYALEVEE